MAESSLLCATSDGMLWNLSECTPEGEWIVDNIWQKKAKKPKTQTLGTELSPHSELDFSMDCWIDPTHLKAQQCKKVSLEGGVIEGGGSKSGSAAAFAASVSERSP